MNLGFGCVALVVSVVACSPATPAAPGDTDYGTGGASGDSEGDGSGGESSGDGAVAPADGAPDDSEPTGLPCEVASVLAEACGDCHGPTPAFGAPMSLTTWEELNAPLPSDGTRFVYDGVLARLADDARPMPPSPRPRLSDADVAAFQAWVDGGTPASSETCDVDYGSDDSGGSGRPLPDPSECDQSLELRAGVDGGGYQVPVEDDHYECFYFKSTLPQNALALAFEPIVDDSRVLHHWLLYRTSNDALRDGDHETCNGIHGDAELLTGWAPGGNPIVMPEDVGMQVPTDGDGQFFILEMHYNNVAKHTDARDRSGLRVCATTKPKQHTAAVHWLGSENIFLLPGQGTAGSTCTPDIEEPIHIIGVSPHMHTLGRHAQMVVNRADGTQEMLLDAPFEFENQVSYDRSVTINPGDSITSTCTFDNGTGSFVRFGESTGDEMCFLFTLAYPAGALDTGGDLLGIGLPGANRCMR